MVGVPLGTEMYIAPPFEAVPVDVELKEHPSSVSLLNVRVCVEDKESDGHKWIQALEVYHEFREYGLGRQLLDYAVKKLGAEYLSVSKKNEIAVEMYQEYGFKLYKETQDMFFYTLNKEQKYEDTSFTKGQSEEEPSTEETSESQE